MLSDKKHVVSSSIPASTRWRTLVSVLVSQLLRIGISLPFTVMNASNKLRIALIPRINAMIRVAFDCESAMDLCYTGCVYIQH